MATLVHSWAVTGSADQEDRLAMELAINEENARRAIYNAGLPVGDTPLAMLPLSTAGERKSSYETTMSAKLAEMHRALIVRSDVATLADVRALWSQATDAKRAAAIAALQ